jgi:hypothetical protein
VVLSNVWKATPLRISKVPRVSAGHESDARRMTDRHGVTMFESGATGSKFIEVWSFIGRAAEALQHLSADIIGQDEKDVWLLFGIRGRILKDAASHYSHQEKGIHPHLHQFSSAICAS